MKLDGKLSYEEIIELIKEWKHLIIGNFIKNIYHWQGLWMFKLNKFRFVFEPGISMWPGDFEPRERNIHSICIKLRKEIIQKKIIDFFVNQNDRTIIIKFNNDRFLSFELFAKGNLILCDENQKIVVLTRPNPYTNHKDSYTVIPFEIRDFSLSLYHWKKKEYEIIQVDNCIDPVYDQYSFSLTEGLESLWNIRKKNLTKLPMIEPKKKLKISKQQNIENQITRFLQKINELDNIIKTKESSSIPDYIEINELYEKIKKLKKKLIGARSALVSTGSNTIVKKNTMKIKIITDKWYHQFIWWYSKKGILCIGGRNAEQNEKIVKTYMKDFHLYLHSDEPGSGSFIYMLDKDDCDKDDADLEYMAQGVLSFSQNWKNNRPGKVYWVYGNQVSKTPETGEYITKGSFIIRGKRNYISVHQLQLGYCLYNDNELMLGPYSLISKLKKKCIKLIPKTNTKKNSHKDIVKHLITFLNIQKIPDDLYIFSFSCIISTNDFSGKI